jgi:hypothetical protein
VCAAFTSPHAAVEAAIAAQRSLQLPVRMGIATGEAEHRGGGYFGAVLNRAARIMSAGHGGQILLDGQTAGVLSGVDLIDLGSKRLRDIASPVDVYQVRDPDLRAEFPAFEDPRSDEGKPTTGDNQFRWARGGTDVHRRCPRHPSVGDVDPESVASARPDCSRDRRAVQ